MSAPRRAEVGINGRKKGKQLEVGKGNVGRQSEMRTHYKDACVKLP